MLLFEISNIFYGFEAIFLYVISLISVLSGILIVITKNPVVSVLYLILLFANISCYLIFIGLNFIGLSYLLVYVGAVSILFLFILMLINIRVSELIGDTNNNNPLAIFTTFAFFLPISDILPGYKKDSNALQFLINQPEQISHVSSSNWDNSILNNTDISSIGNIMYTSYFIWLIITSIILLLAMVGSIIITLKQRIF